MNLADPIPKPMPPVKAFALRWASKVGAVLLMAVGVIVAFRALSGKGELKAVEIAIAIFSQGLRGWGAALREKRETDMLANVGADLITGNPNVPNSATDEAVQREIDKRISRGNP